MKVSVCALKYGFILKTILRKRVGPTFSKVVELVDILTVELSIDFPRLFLRSVNQTIW